MEFDQVEEVLRRADEALDGSQHEREDETATPSSGSSSGEVSDGKRSDDDSRFDAAPHEKIPESARRIAIEQVLTEGVRLGWEYAKAGEGSPPHFEVTWTASGHPQIKNLSAEAAARVLAAQAYRDQVFAAIKRAVYFDGQRLTASSKTYGQHHDFDFVSDEGETWIAVDLNLSSADRLHNLHEAYIWRSEYGYRDKPPLLGVIFIHRSKLSRRTQGIVNMLWTGGHSSKVKAVRWVDESDDADLVSTFAKVDSSLPPF